MHSIKSENRNPPVRSEVKKERRNDLFLLVRNDVAWMLLRDLARRASALPGVRSRAVRRASTTSAALELYHDIGLSLGLYAALRPARRDEVSRDLVRFARTHGMQGVESLVLNSI